MIPDDIKSLLESMHKMSQSEDWDEANAQDLIMCGGKLHEKYMEEDGKQEPGCGFAQEGNF